MCSQTDSRRRNRNHFLVSDIFQLLTPVLLYYRPQIKSIPRLQKDNSGQIGFIVKIKMQD